MHYIRSISFFFFFLIFSIHSVHAQPVPAAPVSSPKQLLLQLNPQLAPDSRSGYDALKALSAAAHLNSSNIHFEYINFIQYHVLTLTNPDTNAEEALNQLKQADREGLILNGEVAQNIQAHAVPNDPALTYQWPISGRNNIGAITAWDVVNTAPSVKIALIDSGLDGSNSDEVSQNLFYYHDYINNNDALSDGFTHGTKIFGILAATSNNHVGISGLLWQAKILSLRVLDNEGNSNITRTLTAIGYAVEQGVKIINLSWGYQTRTPSVALEQALIRARDAGILVVCSAGNNASDNDLEEKNYPSSYGLDNIIAVAATDSNNRLSTFSNFGAQSVDLAAPGTGIYSLVGSEYSTDNGSSFSAPYVTGTAALIWSLKPQLSYRDIKQLILENTDLIPELNGKMLTGGRLNMGRAIVAAQNFDNNLLSSNEQNSTLNTSNNSSNNNSSNENTTSNGSDTTAATTAVGNSSAGGCSLNTSIETHKTSIILLLFSLALLLQKRILIRKKLGL